MLIFRIQEWLDPCSRRFMRQHARLNGWPPGRSSHRAKPPDPVPPGALRRRSWPESLLLPGAHSPLGDGPAPWQHSPATPADQLISMIGLLHMRRARRRARRRPHCMGTGAGGAAAGRRHHGFARQQQARPPPAAHDPLPQLRPAPGRARGTARVRPWLCCRCRAALSCAQCACGQDRLRAAVLASDTLAERPCRAVRMAPRRWSERHAGRPP
jgi:hypothetical protein